jgi:hypothetical protein
MIPSNPFRSKCFRKRREVGICDNEGSSESCSTATIEDNCATAPHLDLSMNSLLRTIAMLMMFLFPQSLSEAGDPINETKFLGAWEIEYVFSVGHLEKPKGGIPDGARGNGMKSVLIERSKITIFKEDGWKSSMDLKPVFNEQAFSMFIAGKETHFHESGKTAEFNIVSQVRTLTLGRSPNIGILRIRLGEDRDSDVIDGDSIWILRRNERKESAVPLR